MEQSIARFEKRLGEANDALKTLSGHLGSGAKGSYKDVTTALTALRRNAAKTNKQALKDFDKLRAALTKTNASAGSSRTTRKSASTSSRTGSGSTASGSTASRSTAKRSTAKRSTATRTTATRTTASRSRAKKS